MADAPQTTDDPEMPEDEEACARIHLDAAYKAAGMSPFSSRPLCTRIDELKRAMVLAVIPLEAIRAGGTDKLHTLEVQTAIAEGIAAVRGALADEWPDDHAC